MTPGPLDSFALQAPEPETRMAPLTRAALCYALWHHLGASSPVGQPVRIALGMGKSQDMTPEQVTMARRVQAALEGKP